LKLPRPCRDSRTVLRSQPHYPLSLVNCARETVRSLFLCSCSTMPIPRAKVVTISIVLPPTSRRIVTFLAAEYLSLPSAGSCAIFALASLCCPQDVTLPL